jgi:hypothetical protein
MAQIADVQRISTILSTVCGAEASAAEQAAQAIGRWLRKGRI